MKIFQVCSFTETPFCGNPAVVCILKNKLSVENMIKISKEMLVSETAFIIQLKANTFSIRWFTPTGVEVSLCGHATLAASHLLYEQKIIHPTEKIIFESMSGNLETCLQENKMISLNFPAIFPLEDYSLNHKILHLLSFDPISIVSAQNRYIVECPNDSHIFDYLPNIEEIKKIEMRGFCLTARSSNRSYDFISRYFAPQVGINEDPVTGSIHCLLAPFWSSKLQKSSLTAFQASERQGILDLKLLEKRVIISGHAVTQFEIRPFFSINQALSLSNRI